MPGTFPNIKSTQAKQPKRPVRAGSVAVNDSVSGSCRMVVRLAVIAQFLCCVRVNVRFNTACEYHEIALDLRITRVTRWLS
jgi:uncharacterized CHY-type Zn-finger protein